MAAAGLAAGPFTGGFAVEARLAASAVTGFAGASAPWAGAGGGTGDAAGSAAASGPCAGRAVAACSRGVAGVRLAMYAPMPPATAATTTTTPTPMLTIDDVRKATVAPDAEGAAEPGGGTTPEGGTTPDEPPGDW